MRSYETRIALAGGKLTFEPATMRTASGAYTVSGWATTKRELEMNFATQKGAAWQVNGTLPAPLVKESAAEPGTRAAAK